jgi:hypothetical protein
VTRLTHEQMLGAPELGILDLLENALDVAILALAAAYPELHDSDLITAPEALAALDLVEAARALGALINRYSLALACAPDDSTDLPF